MPNQHAVEIASVVNNAIVILWQRGQVEAARSKVTFSPVPKGDVTDVLRQRGYSMYTLGADDPALDANFPESMTFTLPRNQVRTIAEELFQFRQNLLTELERYSDELSDYPEDDDVFDSDLPTLGGPEETDDEPHERAPLQTFGEPDIE